MIGGGDFGSARLVPDAMRAAADGGVLMLRNPGAIRPWQHVLNPLSGYLVLAERLWDERDYASGWNFGPDDRDARPVRWIVERLVESWGDGLGWEFDGRPQPPEAQYLKLDSSRAHSRLGWLPRWDLAEGLDRTVEWFRGYRDGADVREVTAAQIEAFERAPVEA